VPANSLLRPFSIGGVVIDPPLALAPMAGLTDVTFRRVVRTCGGVGLTVSEIVSAEGLVRGTFDPEDYLAIDAGEHPVALQLSGSDPVHMAEAAKACEDRGADLLDLNMGCPAPSVTKGRCGSFLLRDPAKAAALAAAVVRAVSIPVTVKMRLGWSGRLITFLEVARGLEGVGVAGLCLHARTKEQEYRGAADWARIAELKAAVSLPVFGNGDVHTPADVLRMVSETACDGVMVGRAAVKNPWIFRQAVQLAREGHFDEPTTADRIALIRAHFSAILAEDRPGLALHRMKTFLGKYTCGVTGAHHLRACLNTCKETDALLEAFELWAAQTGQN